jgi:hypothetical protein
VNRDDEIDIFEVEAFNFNGAIFTEVHISINHINFNEKGNQRSSFSGENVVELFVNAISGQFLNPEGKKEKLVYFVYNFEDADKKRFKAVFNTENGKVYVRLITLFRSR